MTHTLTHTLIRPNTPLHNRYVLEDELRVMSSLPPMPRAGRMLQDVRPANSYMADFKKWVMAGTDEGSISPTEGGLAVSIR